MESGGVHVHEDWRNVNDSWSLTGAEAPFITSFCNWLSLRDRGATPPTLFPPVFPHSSTKTTLAKGLHGSPAGWSAYFLRTDSGRVLLLRASSSFRSEWFTVDAGVHHFRR
jgi:hypothetical protein